MDEHIYDIDRFNAMGRDEQLRVARKFSDKTDSFEDENNRIDLYCHSDFFIEVIYRKELNFIKSIRGIDALEYADLYIELENMDDY